jgi:hypothetical protein
LKKSEQLKDHLATMIQLGLQGEKLYKPLGAARVNIFELIPYIKANLKGLTMMHLGFCMKGLAICYNHQMQGLTKDTKELYSFLNGDQFWKAHQKKQNPKGITAGGIRKQAKSTGATRQPGKLSNAEKKAAIE